MDIKYVKELIQLFEKTSLAKMSIKEKNGEEVTLEKGHPHHETARPHAPPKSHTPVVCTTPPEGVKPPTEQKGDQEIDLSKAIKSPMVGTFYSASSPDQPAFVKAETSVKKGDVLCIIEAMKVMNEIKADRNGVIKKVLVDNAEAVEFGQPLFIIE